MPRTDASQALLGSTPTPRSSSPAASTPPTVEILTPVDFASMAAMRAEGFADKRGRCCCQQSDESAVDETLRAYRRYLERAPAKIQHCERPSWPPLPPSSQTLSRARGSVGVQAGSCGARAGRWSAAAS